MLQQESRLKVADNTGAKNKTPKKMRPLETKYKKIFPSI